MADPPIAWPWTVALLAAVAAFSAIGAHGLRRYALAKDMIDVPGRRSSHTTPTPRGGGLAGALAWLLAVAALWRWHGLDGAWAMALIGGGAPCLAAGWLEDRFGLPILARLALHLAAAGAVLWFGGGLPELTLGPWRLELGPWGWALGALWLVWFVNLFNFMDGIDGIASLETICGGGALGLMLAWSDQWPLAWCAWCLAAAAAGFLALNRPPAKIFMGDAGSYSFGLGLAALALLGVNHGHIPPAAALLALLAFVFDASLTIVRRLLRGEAIHRPHRDHFYQRATRAGLSHGQVDLAVLALNLALMGLAFLTYHRPALGGAALAAGLALVAAACQAVTRLEKRRPPTA